MFGRNVEVTGASSKWHFLKDITENYKFNLTTIKQDKDKVFCKTSRKGVGKASSNNKWSALFLERQGNDDLGQREILEMLSSVQVSHLITEVAMRIYRMHAVHVSSQVCSTLLPILLHPGMLTQVRVLASREVSQTRSSLCLYLLSQILGDFSSSHLPVRNLFFLQRTLLSGPPSSFVTAFPVYLFWGVVLSKLTT